VSAGRSDAALERAKSLLATAADEVLAAPGASELQWAAPRTAPRPTRREWRFFKRCRPWPSSAHDVD